MLNYKICIVSNQSIDIIIYNLHELPSISNLPIHLSLVPAHICDGKQKIQLDQLNVSPLLPVKVPKKIMLVYPIRTYLKLIAKIY